MHALSRDGGRWREHLLEARDLLGRVEQRCMHLVDGGRCAIDLLGRVEQRRVRVVCLLLRRLALAHELKPERVGELRRVLHLYMGGGGCMHLARWREMA